ncbi:VanZ family protein [Gemmatimonas aurantiaca]|uniref:VanZ family protein n=1 Tax=Gemmatimonas aurantiaca TaxID=173480 RepID=UPI00030E5E5B|nr:VanZ family protein [Gemmatimonas aurantiaca]
MSNRHAELDHRRHMRLRDLKNPRLGALLLLALSVAAIVAATLLPGNGTPVEQLPPSWCLRCGGLWLMDGVSNVLLFVPLGVALAWLGWRVPTVLLTGAVLSLGVETLQWLGIPAQRSAALADVLTNTAGACLGLLVVRHWSGVVLARGRQAGWLAVAWTAAAAGAMIGTAIALGPRRHERPPTPSDYRRSAIAYSPGHGWYGGEPLGATINGQPFAHRGSGPIVVEIEREPVSTIVTAEVRGRDTASGLRSFVFVHRAADTSAIVMLAQHGDDAVLAVTRRAWDWGLAMPRLRLEHAFAGHAEGGGQVLALRAHSSPAELSLIAEGPPQGLRAQLRLSATMGWAMLQSVVGVQHPLAPVVLMAWLLWLWAPAAWWSVRSRWAGESQSTMATAFTALGPLAAMVCTMVALPATVGVSRLTGLEWLMLLTAYGSGIVGAWRQLRGNIRPC